MSSANKCDLCNQFYEPVANSVSLDVSLKDSEGDTWSTWSEVDFCPACSEKVLAVIRPAIEDVSPSS